MKKPRQILVVDDDPAMVAVLESWLRNDGYQVKSAISAAAAFVRLEAEPFDCVVLDLMIPGLSGVDIAKKLRGQPRWEKTPLVFITATLGVENDKGDERLEISDQSYPIFAKPLHRQKFLSVVRKEINRAIHAAKPKIV
ncbi:MAG: response regulator [Candidatus Omnitrophica bacterium]|nr:response regulator [Candidatus Omnitrophota bacterium]